MPIIGAYTVPHPPLIVPDIGKGAEEQIIETTNAYKQVAKEIATLKPETIIITSPHTVLYGDYFHISPNDNAYGDFSNFNASNVKFNEEYDTELVNEIEKLANQYNFPMGTSHERDKALDHGVMVPLYFIRQELPKCKIIRVGLSGLPLVDNYRAGEIIQEAVNNLNKRVVFVASGDLSHKLQTYGPYGFIDEGPIYDEQIMKTLSAGAFNELLEYKESFLDKAAECGHRSFTIMAGALDGIEVESKQLSHQDITGVGYGICTFYPQGENTNRKFRKLYLEKERKRLENKANNSNDYIKLAYKTINKYIKDKEVLKVPNDINKELLDNQKGVFVTLNKFDQLRGCIGTFLPTRDNIAEEIISNSISSATSDYRFNKVTEDELPYLDISVYLLNEPEQIDDQNELDPKKYGVIVSSGYKRGLLLPDLDGIDTIEEQLRIAKNKGNITDSDEIQLERFTVTKYE